MNGTMEPNVTKLGTSLKVPNVQELAKKMISGTIPPRYVRSDLDDPSHNYLSSVPEIPIINMQNLLDKDLMETELDRLHTACQEWGFFQLINHGVETESVENMKLEIQEFFNLPIEEKDKFSQETGNIEGYGQLGVSSEEQKLQWADMFYVLALPTHLRNPHLIPKLPASFRDAIEAYANEMKILGIKILDQMAKALGMQNEEMKVLFDQECTRIAMRMNYYPPCPQPKLAIGVSPHSDGTGLTILLQINEKEGLEIKKNGFWIPVSPLPNAFVVNIGDILEIVTNGTYRSIEHRAIVNSEKERLSIATFLTPRLDGYLGPAPSLVTTESPAKYKNIGVADYFKGFFMKERDGKSYIDSLKI